jgi:hypothetical protein
MINIDTLRQSEAEARQEETEPTIDCQMCYATVVKDEAWECPDCHQHYCSTCKPEMIEVCWTCFDREDAFDEVAEIDEDFCRMTWRSEQTDYRPWFRKQEQKREAAMLKAEEERGK